MLKNRGPLCSNNFSSFTWKHTIRIYYNIERRYKTSTVVHKSSVLRGPERVRSRFRHLRHTNTIPLIKHEPASLQFYYRKVSW